jgi:hypothetical protein
MTLQRTAELGEVFVVVGSDQGDPIRKCHAPEGDMNTSASPLFRP